MNTNKWLWGELLAVLRRQSLLYDNPAKIQNIRDIPIPPHFISFACVFLMSVKFQWLILEHQPCEWVCKCRFFFYLAGSMKINMKISNGSAQTFLAIWIQPLPGAHLHFTATAFTFCGNPHLLLLAALQTHSQQLHSNSNEQKTATLNVERTDTV